MFSRRTTGRQRLFARLCRMFLGGTISLPHGGQTWSNPPTTTLRLVRGKCRLTCTKGATEASK
jgi:hypothetical protein